MKLSYTTTDNVESVLDTLLCISNELVQAVCLQAVKAPNRLYDMPIEGKICRQILFHGSYNIPQTSFDTGFFQMIVVSVTVNRAGDKIYPKDTKDVILMSYCLVISFMKMNYSRVHEAILNERGQSPLVGTCYLVKSFNYRPGFTD